MWSTGSVRGGTGSWKGFSILSALLRRLASAFCHVAVRWSSPRGPSFCNSWLLPTLFPLFFSKPLLLLWYFQFKFRIEGLLLPLVLKTTFYTLTLLESSISILTSCCLWLPHFRTHPCSVRFWDSITFLRVCPIRREHSESRCPEPWSVMLSCDLSAH